MIKYDINWSNEEWTIEELKQAVEILSATSWWLAHNEVVEPIPRWCRYTRFDLIRKERILSSWEQWKMEEIDAFFENYVVC